ncbi:MAG TPA: glycoside hydrolase family 30 beta sandwich domain-containing protein [Streptosporangiaceae bacterium]
MDGRHGLSRRAFLGATALGATAAMLPSLGCAPHRLPAARPVPAQRVTTTSDLTTQVLAASPLPRFAAVTPGPSDVVVDPAATYQPFYGTGAALTDSAAYVLWNYLSPAARRSLLAELFAPGGPCRWGMLRVCIGSSDFRSEPVGYTYDDLPSGRTDPGMNHFSVARDRAFIVPVVREILAANPAVKIVATPWTPPAWMLASGTFEANRCTLSTRWYGAYAAYFVKFLRAYKALGIPVWAVTAQNEPLSAVFLQLSQSHEEAFIGSHLGPALASAGFGDVRVLALDDQWTGASYGTGVLTGAGRYVSGIAYHGYAGDPSVMSGSRSAHPSATLHLTEFRNLVKESLATQMAGTAGGYVAQGVAAGASSVMLWNLALDQNGEPNQGKPGRLGVVTVDSSTGAITRRTGYYALAQMSMSAQPGALRCAATTFGAAYVAYQTYPDAVTTAALVNPDGSVVLYAYNGHPSPATFQVVDARTSRGTTVTMAAGELSTFSWPAGQ